MMRLRAAFAVVFLVGVGVGISAGSGALLGERWLLPIPTFTVQSTEIDGESVIITVFNQRLWSASGEVSYRVVTPDGAAVYSAPPLPFSELQARTSAAFAFPLPADLPADGGVVADVTEWIAYASQTADSAALTAQIEVIEPDRSAVITSAVLRRTADGMARLDAALLMSEPSAEAWNYRYALSVGSVSAEDNDRIEIGERVYLSDFVYITLYPDQPAAPTFSATIALPAGAYAVSLWVQADSGAGGWEHFAQVTYPSVFRLLS